MAIVGKSYHGEAYIIRVQYIRTILCPCFDFSSFLSRTTYRLTRERNRIERQRAFCYL